MIGALALWEVPSNSESDPDSVLIDEVFCSSNETRLQNCTYVKKGRFAFYCRYGGGAGVRCREEELRVKNVSVATVDMPYCTKHTVIIFWELHKNSSYKPSSFTVTCFNQQHHTELSMINGTAMQISIGDLLSSTSYTCCVSAIYYRNYETEEECTVISTETLQSDSLTSPVLRSNDRADIIGVLGSINVILLLLLAICGGALLYLLRSRHVILKR